MITMIMYNVYTYVETGYTPKSKLDIYLTIQLHTTISICIYTGLKCRRSKTFPVMVKHMNIRRWHINPKVVVVLGENLELEPTQRTLW